MDTFDLIRLFVDIAEANSLSAVARCRDVAPSTVTLGLQQLEEKVGARLLARTTRNQSLTPEGERFLVDCRRILGCLDDAMSAVGDNGPLRGDIRVTCTHDFGRVRLLPLINDFMHLHPDVQVAVTFSDAVTDLIEERFDLGIRMGALPDSQLAARLLIRSNRVVVASPEYWKRFGKPEHPRDLVNHNCLILARPGCPWTHWHFVEDGKEFTVHVRGDRSIDDGGAIRAWAVAGAGVVMKMHFNVAEDIRAGRLETALDDYTGKEINLYAVRPSGRRAPRRVQALIDFLVDKLRS